MFNHKRLSLARMRRRLTAKALAEKAKLAPDTIYRLEKRLHVPDDETVTRLSRALSYPAEFFYGDDPPEIDTEAVSFRSFSKMSAKERDAATSAGTLGLQLAAWVEDKFSLSPPNLIDLSYETNSAAAAHTMRRYWGLGEKSIGNMLGLLETQGIRIFSLSENTASVNAFSFWRDGKAYIFLNNFKTAESSIFDTAHELGHLVMHKHGDPKGIRSSEREADSFASEFLMPENDVRARMPRPITVDVILRAKERWRISAMAMTYRVHALGMISDYQYKSLCIELGRRGYRGGEPNGISRETSLVWRKVLEQLWNERTTKHKIAAELNLPLDELEGLIWNLAAVNERPREKPILSLV
jgi:Zn-dependent peptidase ImmA (M78 family)/DNA-binding XRE family transcriptional regulator